MIAALSGIGSLALAQDPAPATDGLPVPPGFAQATKQGGDKFPAIKSDPSKYTTLPPREKIFEMRSNDQLEDIIMRLIREDEKRRGATTDEKTLKFPATQEAGEGQVFRPRTEYASPLQTSYFATYVTHRRLHFEEKNAERYGWDFGIIQPLVSTLYFYKDVLLWPNSLASGCAYGFWDTNVGKCLPGSPTPYMLYPPGLTITGTAAEGVILTGAAFIFP